MVKIVDTASGEIVIEDTPWVFGGFLIVFTCLGVYGIFDGLGSADWAQVLICCIVGAGCLWGLCFAIRRVRLILGEDGAELIVRDARGLARTRFARDRLRAGLATDYNDGETYRAILLVEGEGGLERIPLTAYLCSSSRHEEAVARINAWSRATG